MQERTKLRARFTDLVSCVDKQARIVSHPLFGNLQEPRSSNHRNKLKAGEKGPSKFKEMKETFATVVTPVPMHTELGNKDKENTAYKTGKQYLFCDKARHNLDFCKLFKQKPHKEKLDFLKSKGLRFGCLSQGHLSKGCQQRLTCQTCSQKHPTILHFNKAE